VAPLEKKLVVMIDAGHGMLPDGSYSGARNGDAVEDKIVLEISHELMKLNDVKNLQLVMTRWDDKNADLKQRIAVAKEAKVDLLISLHVNSSPDAAKHGFEVTVPKESVPVK
jgi:N-acetylmuramoyl-L-alanine amidase